MVNSRGGGVCMHSWQTNGRIDATDCAIAEIDWMGI